jgi:hypothetical protein
MGKKPSPPTEPVTRKSLVLLDTMWEEINQFRIAEQIATETEAVRRLLRAALRDAARKAKP